MATALARGASAGLRHTRKSTVSESRIAIRMPGTMPAMKSAPIDVSVMTPYRMSGIEGGMRMPSVPPAAVAPSASRGL